MNDELIHYGVKGMKWGVRKDHRSKVPVTRSNAQSRIRKKMKDLLTAYTPSVANGQQFLHNSHIMDLPIQQANQIAMQEATRASINASLQASSLSMSGGMNPFMFGMI